MLLTDCFFSILLTKVLSHRALVVVGNLSGSAGFGFGKSANVNDD